MTAAPLLLRAPLAETELAPRSLDFQVRVGRPARTTSSATSCARPTALGWK